MSFIKPTRVLMGDEEYQKLSAALGQEPPVSVQLNNKFTDSLSYSSISGYVPWTTGGYHPDQQLTSTFDPLFHAECYHVQEVSSMFAEQISRRYITAPVKMLDLCAAPGRKSTHARNPLSDESLLMTNEVVRNCLQILAENLTK